MKKYYKRLEVLVFFLLIWVILNENFRLDTLITGGIVSLMVLVVTNKLIGMDYAEEFYEPPYSMLVYFAKLFVETYKAAFDVVKRIFNGNIHPTFVEYETDLKEDRLVTLLSRTVTVVPGTVVYEQCGDKILVLAAETNPQVTLDDMAHWEKTLQKLERNR